MGGQERDEDETKVFDTLVDLFAADAEGSMPGASC